VVPPVSYPSGVGLTDRQARKEGGIAMAKGINTMAFGTLSLTVVSWKRTAKMKKFQSLPDLHPVAVVDTVKVCGPTGGMSVEEYFRLFDPEEITVKIDGRWENVVELQGGYLLIATKREEFYKIADDKFLVVSYSLSPREGYWKWRRDGYRELKKDYLLLVNGYKIRIPKPKACNFGVVSHSGIEGVFKLERILRGEEKLKFAWEWHQKLRHSAATG
jgi:hypothetical protein